jgi:hypothetical protein
VCVFNFQTASVHTVFSGEILNPFCLVHFATPLSAVCMFVSAVSMSRSEVENSPVVRIPHYFDWLSNLVRYFFHHNQEQGDTHNRRLSHSIFDVSSCDVLVAMFLLIFHQIIFL